MTFLVRPGAPRYAAQLHARALEGWRGGGAAGVGAVGWRRTVMELRHLRATTARGVTR